MARRPTIFELVVCGAIVVVLLALLLPPVGSDREPEMRRGCLRNLQSVGIALRNYHQTYGEFPPASIADEAGRPMHSWRVLLLPFFDRPEFKELYDAYHFDEPWDGPRNVLLHDRAARLGRRLSCPRDWQDMHQRASYLAVVGDQTAWPRTASRKLSDLTDGPGNTLLVVEVWNSNIHWLEPRDLLFDEMCFGINDASECGIRSEHRTNTYWTHATKDRFAYALYADGQVRSLSESTPPRVVRGLLTVAGKEDVDRP